MIYVVFKLSSGSSETSYETFAKDYYAVISMILVVWFLAYSEKEVQKR